MKFKQVLWWALHDLVVHPMMGWWGLLTLGRPTPEWIDRFHDFTAEQAWGAE